MTENLDLTEQIYMALVAKYYQVMEPEIKEKLIEFWREHHTDELIEQGLSPDIDPENIDLDLEELSSADYGVLTEIARYLTQEIETQEEWDENRELWTNVGNFIWGFVEWMGGEDED